MSQIHPAFVILIAIGVALLAAAKVFLLIKMFTLSPAARLSIMAAVMFFLSGNQFIIAFASLDGPSYGFPIWLHMTIAAGMFISAIVLLREALKAPAKLEA